MREDERVDLNEMHYFPLNFVQSTHVITLQCVSCVFRPFVARPLESIRSLFFVLQERSRLASRLRENDQSRSNEKVRAPRNIIFLYKYVWCLILTFRCFSVYFAFAHFLHLQRDTYTCVIQECANSLAFHSSEFIINQLKQHSRKNAVGLVSTMWYGVVLCCVVWAENVLRLF